ncbi:MAG: hypothetical protein Q4E99_02870 [Bacillota bacterium]|nr:hypothetical protein [Bacillota bacterium]
MKKKLSLLTSLILVLSLMVSQNAYCFTAYGQEIVVRTIGDLVNALQQNGQVFSLYQKPITIQSHKESSGPSYSPEPIHYITASESETADMILFDDEIAYWYSLSNHNKNVKPANSVTVKTSGISHKEHCEDKDAEAVVNIEVQDLTDYNIFANILTSGKLEHIGEWITQIVGSNSKETILDKFNHWFIGHKDKVKDKITLYPGKNDIKTKTELNQLVGVTEAYKPVSYKQGEGEDVVGILRNLFINMNYDYSCGGCGAEGTVTLTDNENMNAQNSGPFTIKYQYGKAGLSEIEPDKKAGLETHEIFEKSYNSNAYKNTFDTKDKFLQFYPYIKMRYSTDKNTSMQDVYVTATNRSKLRENLVVNVFTEDTKDKDTIELEGDWTTHNSAINVLSSKGITDPANRILKGGANLSLKTKGTIIDKEVNTATKANNILVESFITCVPDEISNAFYSKTYTESEALIELDKFKKNIINTLDKYSLEKWVAEGVYKNQDEFIQKADCVQGNNEVNSIGGNELNKKVSKYYLSTKDNNKAKNAYINSEVEHEQVDVFMVQVNTYGDLLFYKNRIYQGCLYKSKFKEKWTNTLLKDIGDNEEWFILNSNTCIIDNLVGCLDKNLGKSGRFGGYEGWYNEAIDGISIVRQELDINLHINDEKFDIQDPALCGKLDSAYDLWSTDDNKWRTCQYRLSNKGNGTEIHEIGTLCGTKVYINDTENLLKSKLFYIGNGTVEDQ